MISFEEMIAAAKEEGGKIIAPNNLPILVVRHDNTMLEHEHADHIDYKFPVYAEMIKTDEFEYEEYEKYQTHALIYTDSQIALTLFECCYYVWSLHSGRILHGSGMTRNSWELTKESQDKIMGYCSEHNIGKD